MQGTVSPRVSDTAQVRSREEGEQASVSERHQVPVSSVRAEQETETGGDPESPGQSSETNSQTTRGRGIAVSH